MSARPAIPNKVRAILPMCGSKVDAEALSACRAIGRVLDRAGLGFTDLAAAIPTGEGQDQLSRRQDKGCGAAPFEFSRRHEKPFGAERIRPFDAYAWKRAYTPRQEAEHRARVQFCQSRPWHLTEWERGFVENLARLHGNLTIRQGDRLAALTDRLDQEARRA